MPQGQQVIDAYSDDQLHRRACIACGRGDGELVPAGYVRADARSDEPLSWVVVACPEYRSAA